jgi:hypothetical protein
MSLTGIKLPPPQVRMWLYVIATTVLALCVAYGLLEADKVPLWLALIGAVLGIGGNALAGLAVHQQRRTGLLDNEEG